MVHNEFDAASRGYEVLLNYSAIASGATYLKVSPGYIGNLISSLKFRCCRNAELKLLMNCNIFNVNKNINFTCFKLKMEACGKTA